MKMLRLFYFLCILLLSTPLFAKPFDYWDHFRIPQRDSISYEISASTYRVELYDNYSDHFDPGEGVSLSFLRDKNDFRWGIDIGFISFDRKSDIDREIDKGYQKFTFTPLLLSFGIIFRPINFINIIPYFAGGPAFAFLEKEYYDSSGNAYSDDDTALYPVFKPGLDVRFNFGPVFAHLGFAFGSMIEFSSTVTVLPITIVSTSLGVRF